MLSNEYIEHGKYIEMIIMSKGVKYVCFVDKKDYSKIKDYKWSLTHNGYVVSKSKGKQIQIHRIIMDFYDKSKDIDHINHNKLDNRKRNLRIVTRSQNNMNRLNTKGYYFDKENNKWRAYIEKNGKRTYLGRFSTKDEAIKKRKEAEKQFFGVFAITG